MPVTFIDPKLDLPERGKGWRSNFDETVYSMYKSPQIFENVPIEVQMVGRRLEEGECLVLAGIVDEAKERGISSCTILALRRPEPQFSAAIPSSTVESSRLN